MSDTSDALARLIAAHPDDPPERSEAMRAVAGKWERVGVLALKLDEWADDLNNASLTDIASELLVMAQVELITAARDALTPACRCAQ